MLSWIFLTGSVSPGRKIAALMVAISVDLLRLVLVPVFVAGALSPWDDILDIITATTLLLVLGFRWRLLAGLLIELIPLVETFPTWTALVLSLPTTRPGTLLETHVTPLAHHPAGENQRPF